MVWVQINCSHEIFCGLMCYVFCTRLTPSWSDRPRTIGTYTSLSRAEMDRFTQLQLTLQLFCLIRNLWCKLNLKKRKHQQTKIKWGGHSRVAFPGLMLQLAWFPNAAPAFSDKSTTATIVPLHVVNIMMNMCCFVVALWQCGEMQMIWKHPWCPLIVGQCVLVIYYNFVVVVLFT